MQAGSSICCLSVSLSLSNLHVAREPVDPISVDLICAWTRYTLRSTVFMVCSHCTVDKEPPISDARHLPIPPKWKDLPIQPYTVAKAPTQLKKLEIVLAVLASLYSSHYPIDTTPPQASLPTTKPLRYRIYPFANGHPSLTPPSSRIHTQINNPKLNEYDPLACMGRSPTTHKVESYSRHRRHRSVANAGLSSESSMSCSKCRNGSTP